MRRCIITLPDGREVTQDEFKEEFLKKGSSIFSVKEPSLIGEKLIYKYDLDKEDSLMEM
jgi:hypothetical protein